MASLYLLCGIPASGKSTWVKQHAKPNTIVISRDEIRLSMLGEDDDYFSHEKDVRKEVYRQANAALMAGKNVIIDQTSVSKASRALILSYIYAADSFGVIYFDVPFEVCVERNNQRDKESRSFVPKIAMTRFYKQFEKPTIKEGFSTIVKVDKDGNWEIEEHI